MSFRPASVRGALDLTRAGPPRRRDALGRRWFPRAASSPGASSASRASAFASRVLAAAATRRRERGQVVRAPLGGRGVRARAGPDRAPVLARRHRGRGRRGVRRGAAHPSGRGHAARHARARVPPRQGRRHGPRPGARLRRLLGRVVPRGHGRLLHRLLRRDRGGVGHQRAPARRHLRLPGIQGVRHRGPTLAIVLVERAQPPRVRHVRSESPPVRPPLRRGDARARRPSRRDHGARVGHRERVGPRLGVRGRGYPAVGRQARGVVHGSGRDQREGRDPGPPAPVGPIPGAPRRARARGTDASDEEERRRRAGPPLLGERDEVRGVQRSPPRRWRRRLRRRERFQPRVFEGRRRVLARVRRGQRGRGRVGDGVPRAVVAGGGGGAEGCRRRGGVFRVFEWVFGWRRRRWWCRVGG